MIRVLVLILFFSLNTKVYSQSETFSIEFENESLEDVLDLVTAGTDYFFSYNSAIMDSTSRFTMEAFDISLEDFLNRLLRGTGLEHQIMADQVIIRSVPFSGNSSIREDSSISGRVIDSLTNQPIPAANVFLSGTNIGSVTDIEGYYMIDRVPPGSYEVIFSHLSYKMFTRQAVTKAAQMRTLNASLSERSFLLDTLNIVSKRLIGPKERKRFIEIFKDEFLGRSSAAMNCEIINPEILDFIYEGGSDLLEVFALAPVKVDNKHLGYQITYYFEKFSKRGSNVDFYGRARFDYLRPENNRQKRAWIRNRRKLYFGSFLHFRRSLVNRELKKEDFRISVVKTNSLTDVPNMESKRIALNDILRQDEEKYTLNFDGFLKVVYRRKVDELYLRQFYESSGTNYQQSLIRLKEGPVKINSNGGLEYPGLETFGYWYWERIGDLLPENYDPETDQVEM